MSDEELTPLMRQYKDIKRRYPHALLFFRVGDFYEMFFEDAELASRLLSITLTSRDKQSPHPIPLCGVPYHAATTYIAKLLKEGKTVALCEQVEDPKLAKGLVRREVVRVFTPGTLVETDFLSPKEPNYLSALSSHADRGQQRLLGVATIEVSTGEFWVTEFHGPLAMRQAMDELARLEPRELLLTSALALEVAPRLGHVKGIRLCEKPSAWFDRQTSLHLLREHFQVPTLDVFGCHDLTVSIEAAGAILQYVRETQPGALSSHIRRLTVRWPTDSMHLDSHTISNLELLRPLATSSSGTASSTSDLLTILDQTMTAMGARLLREWIVRPLLNCDQIRSRLEAVAELKDRWEDRRAIRTCLADVQDVARLTSRIALRCCTPRELLGLKKSLSVLPTLMGLLAPLRSNLLADLRDSFDDGKDLHEVIEQAIQPDAPPSVRDGNVIKEGYHPGIDELRKVSKEWKQWLADLESKERARSGIDSLKVRYNQVFGYYIEVTKANLHRVPSDYVRKQTLVNAERFVTPELSSLEEKITSAEVKLAALELEVFGTVLNRVAEAVSRLEHIAAQIALLDVISALAEAAALYRYTKPIVDEGGSILIRDGRHPVVEQLRHDRPFVPNDVVLDQEENRLIILTGPNMAGKSTYLRQVALIVLMAQMGSFVPASFAHIGIVDRIFTRVGASDSLAEGLSTFMVEMVETAHILHHASPRSLILLDEVGRGTSTYDGLSIAWAVAEYIHDRRKLGARTLFATHYHELAQLASQQNGIKNYRVAVQERDEDVVFLYKIVEGGADRSYGIHVAKLAGLPDCVIKRAIDILAQLEEPESSACSRLDGKSGGQTRPVTPLKVAPSPANECQMDLFPETFPPSSVRPVDG
ncbi:MAG: DNA mismatch repair protein MutS [Nitrospira sp.]|nr:DNA mismatch repair protein MutS [Nitrospira sp.]